MKLMTKELTEKIPALYEQEDKGEDAIVYVHWFSITGWDWYCTEYDPESGLCFGLVKGFDTELGYWTLGEFEEVNRNNKFGFPIIERDLWWKPCKLADVR